MIDYEKIRQRFLDSSKIDKFVMQLFYDHNLQEEPYFLGEKIFPVEPTMKDIVSVASMLQYESPMSYVSPFEIPPQAQIPTDKDEALYRLAVKAEQDYINEEVMWYLKLSDNPIAKDIESAETNIKKQLAIMTNRLRLRNEIEVWSSLTTGRVTTLHGVTFDQPWKNFDITHIGSGICYHDRESWFNSSGVPDASYDFVKYFREVDKVVAERGGRPPTKCFMNSTTFSAFLANTKLNTQIQGVYVPFWYSYATQTKNRRYSIYKIPPLQIDIVVYDAHYMSNRTTRTNTAFIPDYYAIFIPDTVGKRYVAPNKVDGKPKRYGRTFTDIQRYLIQYEIGEVSLPVPDDFVSPYIVYTKAAQ